MFPTLNQEKFIQAIHFHTSEVTYKRIMLIKDKYSMGTIEEYFWKLCYYAKYAFRSMLVEDVEQWLRDLDNLFFESCMLLSEICPYPVCL